MNKTTLNSLTNVRPSICAFQDKLFIAWPANPSGQIQIAAGDVQSNQAFKPTTTALANATSATEVALAVFEGRLVLAFVGPDGRIHLAFSKDGQDFSYRMDLAERSARGVSLAVDGGTLLLGWTEPVSRRIAIAATRDGGTFDQRVTLPWESVATPTIEVVPHPYYGRRAAVSWIDSNSAVQLLVSDPNRLSTFGALAALPLPFKSSVSPTLFGYRPVGENRHRLFLCFRDDVSGAVSLVSGDADGEKFGVVQRNVANLASSSASCALATQDPAGARVPVVCLAYAETFVGPLGGNVVVGDYDQIFPLPDDLRALVGSPCSPEKCPPDPRLVCVVGKETHFVRAPAQMRNGRRGYLILTAADGFGTIGTILRNMSPRQFYDHMGILVDDFSVVRHTTEAKDWLKAEHYYTGSILGDRAPSDGIRPDHLKYGWPGPITQTVENAFFTGFNAGANKAWDLYALSGRATRLPPPGPGASESDVKDYRRGESFIDPEAYNHWHQDNWGYTIPNMTLAPQYPVLADGTTVRVPALIVQPPPGATSKFPWIEWLLDRIVVEAEEIDHAHYRFFAYTDASTGWDASKAAPAKGDAYWLALPPDADWSAGSAGLVCSTFVWLAATRAANGLNPPLRLGNKLRTPKSEADLQNPFGGGNVPDGLYAYSESERRQAAYALHELLVREIHDEVKRKVDDAYPTLARFGVGALIAVLAGPAAAAVATLALSPAQVAELVELFSDMPNQVANQVCMAFAKDVTDQIDSQDWQQPGAGVSVSPDNFKEFWDEPEETADFRRGPYGFCIEALITPSRWEEVPIGFYGLSPGVCNLYGKVEFAGRPVIGALVRVGHCWQTESTVEGFKIAVPASPPRTDTERNEQIVTVQATWTDASGQVWQISGEVRANLPTGAYNIGIIHLVPPPEWRRRVSIHGHMDMLYQVLVGKNTINHQYPTWTTDLQYNANWIGRPDYTADMQTGDTKVNWEAHTEYCSTLRAEIHMVIQLMPDLRLSCWYAFAITDTDDNEIELQQGVFDVPKDGSFPLNVSLKDSSEPPDRAGIQIEITNNRCPA